MAAASQSLPISDNSEEVEEENEKSESTNKRRNETTTSREINQSAKDDDSDSGEWRNLFHICHSLCYNFFHITK